MYVSYVLVIQQCNVKYSRSESVPYYYLHFGCNIYYKAQLMQETMVYLTRSSTFSFILLAFISFLAWSEALLSHTFLPSLSIPYQCRNFSCVSASIHSDSGPSLNLDNLPPIPELASLPLPAKLFGGLLLFSSSVKGRDKDLAQKLQVKAQNVINLDPLLSMELGRGLEAGGIFCSTSSIDDVTLSNNEVATYHQLIIEFQINGGNSWAQCRCHGYQLNTSNRNSSNYSENDIYLVSLRVSNMDAAFNGGWMDVKLNDENNSDTSTISGSFNLPYSPNEEDI